MKTLKLHTVCDELEIGDLLSLDEDHMYTFYNRPYIHHGPPDLNMDIVESVFIYDPVIVFLERTELESVDSPKELARWIKCILIEFQGKLSIKWFRVTKKQGVIKWNNKIIHRGRYIGDWLSC